MKFSVFVGAVLASAIGTELGWAFDRSMISECSSDPLNCATGTPEPKMGSSPKLEKAVAEIQQQKFVFFGTNRKIESVDLSNRNLYKISSFFSDENQQV